MSKALDIVPLTLMSGGRIKPAEHLDLARWDIVKGDTPALVNALGNIKQAIDIQMDVLLEVYGLLRKSMEERWPFPVKLYVIGKLGIVSHRILNRINTLRNKMEYEHLETNKDVVTECLDIAEMLLEIFKHQSYGIKLVIDYDGDYAFIMDREKGEIRVYDNTKRLLDCGGAHMFDETVREKELSPIETIPISNLEAWIEACVKYARIP